MKKIEIEFLSFERLKELAKKWGNPGDKYYCGPGNRYHHGNCTCHVTGPHMCVFHNPSNGIFKDID
jgi:hypothetical protein